jgi:hypothetical protein
MKEAGTARPRLVSASPCESVPGGDVRSPWGYSETRGTRTRQGGGRRIGTGVSDPASLLHFHLQRQDDVRGGLRQRPLVPVEVHFRQIPPEAS